MTTYYFPASKNLTISPAQICHPAGPSTHQPTLAKNGIDSLSSKLKQNYDDRIITGHALSRDHICFTRPGKTNSIKNAISLYSQMHLIALCGCTTAAVVGLFAFPITPMLGCIYFVGGMAGTIAIFFNPTYDAVVWSEEAEKALGLPTETI